MLLDNIYSNILCYSTMYNVHVSCHGKKYISIYILVRLSLEYYVLLRRWEINVRASLEGEVQNILYTRAYLAYYQNLSALRIYILRIPDTRNHYNQFGILSEFFKNKSAILNRAVGRSENPRVPVLMWWA